MRELSPDSRIALRGSLTPLIQHILTENRRKSLPSQWATLIPTTPAACWPCDRA